MEESHSQEETSRQEKTEDLAHLDEVDYKRLARLTTQIPSPQQTLGGAPFVTAAPRAKSALPLVLVAAAFILFIILGIVGYWLTSARRSQPIVSQEESPPRETPNKEATPTGRFVQREMIAIPGGTFQMGRNDGPPQESPPHTVTVSAFYIDNTEVTNAEYANFVRETGHAAPSHFVNGKSVAGQEQLPVVNVSIEDAQAFAAWRSKRDDVTYRLPTEEEWEYAARNGEQNNLYPWGNSFDANRAAVRTAKLTSLRLVGSYPGGKNRWGVLDLIGNAWEWTASKAAIYPGGKGQVQPEQKDWYVIRGGSIASDTQGDRAISSTYRDWIKPTTVSPFLGFRLVRSNVK